VSKFQTVRNALSRQPEVEEQPLSEETQEAAAPLAFADVRDALREFVRSIDPGNGNPNTEPLWELIRDSNLMRLNIKNMGYDIARALSDSRMSGVPEVPPAIRLGWCASTQVDVESAWVAYWCHQLGIRPLYHRKVWELAYVLQSMWSYGKITPGMRGLGFGCGEEPLPSYLAAHGVDVVATDLPPDHEGAVSWRNTAQHTDSLDKLRRDHLVGKEAFDRHVSLEYVDMNAIPEHLRDFDFCWSICAFEHVGSIEQGLQFVVNSMDTLKTGGVSIHTTEFNFQDGPTIDNWPTVLFQKQHFEDLARRLTAAGHRAEPISFDVGNGALDRFIDLPPYADYPSEWQSIQDFPAHMKLSVDGFPCTCYGIVVEKG
jgi:2-polyprenyl-3-methyl-5-hydroxy-6-metoxy-1,4-benzoquinol methylase